MDVDEWSRNDLAVLWGIGAVFTGGILLALYFWPKGEKEWLAIALAATLPVYHVWKVRTTLTWLQEEYGFRFGASGGDDSGEDSR